MKKLTMFLTVIISLVLVTGLTDADALDLPVNAFIELDLDNWTRLYYDDDTLVPYELPGGDIPAGVGIESKAFITFNDISRTLGPGGGDVAPFWVGGTTDGTYLHGWERNVVLIQKVEQADGSWNLYFDHATTNPNDPRYWEVEVYQTGVSTTDFIMDDPDFLKAGPTQFDNIATNLAASGSLFIRGRFAKSVFCDTAITPYLPGFQCGAVIASVAISVPNPGLLGGEWVNQTWSPYALGINAFIDVDPTVGDGEQFSGGFYGISLVDGSEYDLPIQNVRLNSEIGGGIETLDSEPWIISDDGVRGSTIEEDEGGSCRVTGGGWDDILAVTVPAPEAVATITSNGKNGPVYSFGGQAGAPSASSIPPYGEWQHNFGKSRGPNDEYFSFHGGTSSSPRGTHETQITSISCSDEGWCFPAREAPFHSIYFDGCGTFTNVKNVDFEVGKVHYFKVHIDDLGEGPGKLAAAGDKKTPPGQLKKSNGCPDHEDLHPIDPDTGAPECAECNDWYEITIYPGVEPGAGACEAAQALAVTEDPIHSVADYINGGNLQIHPPTGADAKK